jgi:hypothetical protein
MMHSAMPIAKACHSSTVSKIHTENNKTKRLSHFKDLGVLLTLLKFDRKCLVEGNTRVFT